MWCFVALVDVNVKKFALPSHLFFYLDQLSSSVWELHRPFAHKTIILHHLSRFDSFQSSVSSHLNQKIIIPTPN